MSKTFKDYKEEYEQAYNKGLEETGVFFAFSKEQFNENKQPKDAKDNEFISVGLGGYIHESNKKKLDDFINIKAKELQETFKSKVKLDDMIEYELINHECYYTGDYLEILDLIRSYYTELSEEEAINKIKEVYLNNKDKYDF